MTVKDLKNQLDKMEDDQEVIIKFAVSPTDLTGYYLDIMRVEKEWGENPRAFIYASFDTDKETLSMFGQPDLKELYERDVMGLWSKDAVIDETWKDVPGISTDGHRR